MSGGLDVRERWEIAVTGAVQGVGFRPYVYRLARACALSGWVSNTGEGVLIEAEGAPAALAGFLARLPREAPSHAVLRGWSARALVPIGTEGFAVAASAPAGPAPTTVMADLATCPHCRAEVFDPANRRHRYPFTTCTDCGPRYSVIAALPYDRGRTTLRHFTLCPDCADEYTDPASRRFHAVSICCPRCGPQLALWDAAGTVTATGDAALAGAAEALREGRIVALKGLGGFQLLADARRADAVALLRARKRRPRKPFAVMVADTAAAALLADVAPAEAALLASAAAPIVLLRPRAETGLAGGVAPGSPTLGLMLPTTPLHHLLLRDVGFPLVCTSGNHGGAPILTDEKEALRDLDGIADVFLVHDRPIAAAVDDSVVRVIAGQATVLRRARGYAPLPIAWPAVTAPLLALGGHEKSAIATGAAGQIVLGAHGGDLDDAAARAAFTAGIGRQLGLHGLRPDAVACDTHPDYASTQAAPTFGRKVVAVPHHLAHALAGMVDCGLSGDVLAVTWDGTGDGGDGTVWGGEFLAIGGGRWRRPAHLLAFKLPGAAAAVREPRRAAVGALHALHGAAALTMEIPPVTAFTPAERRVLATMLARGLNTPMTTSAGRLFDAAAALLGLCQRASHEAEAAMALEAAAQGAVPARLAPCDIGDDAGRLVVDWRPLLADLMTQPLPPEMLAAGFHAALADAIVAVARRLGAGRVLLTGGCFQNARLTEMAVAGLAAAGIACFRHGLVPPNDGGLAVGQIAFAARPLIQETD